jgi:HEAT repeat protein
MTDLTLRRYLDDQLAEIRRAAALGLAKRNTKAHTDRLADLLLDPEPLVGQAAHTALCQLSGQDFGPGIDADEAGRAEAVERWKKWWQGKR